MFITSFRDWHASHHAGPNGWFAACLNVGSLVMVEAKDSTSLGGVSRRELLGGETSLPQLSGWEPSVGQLEDEPLVRLWLDWKRLHSLTILVCHRTQDLEAHLLRTLGPPLVLVQSLANPKGVPAWSHEDIDRILSETKGVTSSGPALHAELSRRKGRWSAEGNRLGFDEAMENEREAWRRESDASSAIFRAAAATLTGVQVKIALMIQMCVAEAADRSFPLPQLESTFKDLAALAKGPE